MSDSFADLWASSAPTKPTQKQPQQKLSSVQSRRPQYDAFSILSASQPSSQPVVNNQRNDRQSRQPQVISRSQDAFSGLFTPSLDGAAAGRNSDQANMTMAERAALSRRAKKSDSTAQVAQVPASSTLWDGLDTLARPPSASPPPTVMEDDFDFGFGGVSTTKGVSSTTSPKTNAAVANDDWGFHELSSPSPSESQSASNKPVPTSAALWDLDEFGHSGSQTSQARFQPSSRSLTGTPGDFDFGDREDGLLGGDSDTEDTFGIRSSRIEHPEDDILGDLGKPVSHSHSPSPNPSTSANASPPPHITGKLVEMGFSPADARAALVNTMTDSGFDVQAATELLLSQAGENGPTPSHSDSHERERPRDLDSNGDRDRATRRHPPTHIDPRTQPTSQMHPKFQTQSQPDTTAEKLLSQASEIGRGMFSKANALWKEGKERAVKMYEERAAASSATSAVTSEGRPRWMRDRDHAPDEWRQPDQTNGRNTAQAGFEDEDGDQGRGQRECDRRPPSGRLPRSQSEREPDVDLFSTDSPTTYQSPFRRGKPKETAPQPSSRSSLSPPVLSPQATVSVPSGSSTSRQPPRPARMFTTTIALSALTSSSSHKSAGTDAYKRGDFPMALAAYVRALAALPPEHILRVPILTNVALVRSKLGELRDAIKACEEAVIIVRRFIGGVGEEPEGMTFAGTESEFDEKTSLEVGSGKVSVLMKDGGAQTNGDLPTSIDLVEGISKAFRRRAEALEGLEKWDGARSTWEVLLGAEWAGAGVKKEAIKGVGRCRKMIDGGGAGQSRPPAPKPNSIRPTPKPSAPPAPSAALTALRSTHDAQQSEDAARLECKEAVETRLNAWKSGKEGNIRALLTSLDDTILWPELRWRKVGMAEVVSKGQVKGAYMRAIARVHPDKLTVGNTTVEQRMVANGVFGTLNEAWSAFQQQ